MGKRKQDLLDEVLRPKNIIYGLRDPRCKDVFYVGLSSVGLTRPRRHKKDAIAQLHNGHHKNNYSVHRHVRSLLKDGVDYIIDVLEIIPNGYARSVLCEAEKKWIAHFRSLGVELMNHTLGGDGCNVGPKPESWKKVISEMNLGGKHPQARPVICLDDGKEFETIRQAARFYNVLEDAIKCYCHGIRKSLVNGMKFAFLLKKQS